MIYYNRIKNVTKQFHGVILPLYKYTWRERESEMRSLVNQGRFLV